MYIRSVHIRNIRSIAKLDLDFNDRWFPGWNVIIGDNGAGKTSIIRAISLGLLGPQLAPALRESWESWIMRGSKGGTIELFVDNDTIYDGRKGRGTKPKNYFLWAGLGIEQKTEGQKEYFQIRKLVQKNIDGPKFNPGDYLWSGSYGWFSAAFGPFRRLRGGDKDKERIFSSYPKVGAHITAYGEDAALTEIESWLRDLSYKERDGDPISSELLKSVMNFINEGELLPHGATIERIAPDGVFFKDGNGNTNPINELSDGFRSILSLTMELIRQLIDVYGYQKVFQAKGKIIVPGVVLIDEVDAHLHPAWQTKIGQWFTKYFPKLQFIVTTHSPLICRACGDHGKIFRLAAPGSGKESGEISREERDKLVFGDILEAYETDAFGDGVEWSDEGRKLQKEYRELVYNRRYGVQMTKTQEERLLRLKEIFKSNVEAD
jgi:hypothetical protein